jgi:hypothetical protein
VLAAIAATREPEALAFLLAQKPTTGTREALAFALATFPCTEASLAIARIFDEPEPPDEVGLDMAATGTAVAFDELVKHLHGQSVPHRLQAIEGLALHADPLGLEHLRSCLDDQDPVIRQHALRNLGNRQEREVLDILWPFLSSEDSEERKAAAMSLPGIPEDRLESLIRTVLDIPGADPFTGGQARSSKHLGSLLLVGEWLAQLAKEGLLPATPPRESTSTHRGGRGEEDEAAERLPGYSTQCRRWWGSSRGTGWAGLPGA